MSKTKNAGLDQYGAEPFEQQQFGTAGVEGVKTRWSRSVYIVALYVGSAVSTRMGDCTRASKPPRYLVSHPGQLSLTIPIRVRQHECQ